MAVAFVVAAVDSVAMELERVSAAFWVAHGLDGGDDVTKDGDERGVVVAVEDEEVEEEEDVEDIEE